MLESSFCPILGGDTRNSRRLFAALASGCVPVLFESFLPDIPFSWAIDPANFSLTLPAARLKEGLVEELRRMPRERYAALSKGTRRAAVLFDYDWPFAVGGGIEKLETLVAALKADGEDLQGGHGDPQDNRAFVERSLVLGGATGRKAQHQGALEVVERELLRRAASTPLWG